MTKRRAFLVSATSATVAAAIAAAVAIACSETGPDADPRTNGCIAANCFDGSVLGNDGATPGVDSSLPPVPDGGYPDPLVGTTKSGKLIKGGYQFVEGPVWISNRLIFSETPASTLHQLVSDGGIGVFRTPSGGPNGNAVDPMGRLVTCESNSGQRRLTRTDAQLAGRTTIAQGFNGSGFDQPNDVIVRADGNIYFTDPCYGCELDGGQEKTSVYRLPPGAAVDGAVRIDPAFDFNQPNGIALSPDGNTLYVVENGANRVLSVKLKTDGTLDGTLGKLVDAQGGDGMAVDLAGNLYVAAEAGVLVFNKTGTPLGIVTVPQGKPANCTFGGADMRTLYITSNNGGGNAATGLYSITLNVPGLP